MPEISLPAASGILFTNAIDFDLKAAIAKRMLQFPDTLAEDGLVELAAKCLASGRPVDRMVLMAIWPLGRLQTVMLELQDHFEALLYIVGRGRPIPEWLRPARFTHATCTQVIGGRLSTDRSVCRDSAREGCSVSRTYHCRKRMD